MRKIGTCGPSGANGVTPGRALLTGGHIVVASPAEWEVTACRHGLPRWGKRFWRPARDLGVAMGLLPFVPLAHVRAKDNGRETSFPLWLFSPADRFDLKTAESAFTGAAPIWQRLRIGSCFPVHGVAR
jgi:hypothetical protein